MFKKLESFFKEHRLEWSHCAPVCDDKAPSMMGSKRGFMSFVKWQKNDISVVHCLLHRENLAAKEIQEDLAIVFKEVVTVLITLNLVPYTLVYFVSCVTKWMNTMDFHSIQTFVGYREDRC